MEKKKAKEHDREARDRGRGVMVVERIDLVVVYCVTVDYSGI